MIGVLITKGKYHVKTDKTDLTVRYQRQRLSNAVVSQIIPRITDHHQKLGRVEKEEILPRISEELYPYQHLDFGFLASRTVREQVSVVLVHPVCDTLLPSL